MGRAARQLHPRCERSRASSSTCSPQRQSRPKRRAVQAKLVRARSRLSPSRDEPIVRGSYQAGRACRADRGMNSGIIARLRIQEGRPRQGAATVSSSVNARAETLRWKFEPERPCRCGIGYQLEFGLLVTGNVCRSCARRRRSDHLHMSMPTMLAAISNVRRSRQSELE